MEKTKSSKYWENRKEWLIYHQMESADKTADRIGKLYHRAYLEIEKKMNNVLDRFAFKYRMSREQALDILERLNNKNDVDELIKELRLHGDNIDIKELSMMMDSPSYWYRINALKDTMAEVDTVMKLVYNNELAMSTEHYKKAANDSFLKNTYTLQQQTGYGYRVSTLPPETVSKLLKSKWSGANYSKRIWNNTTTLAGDLKTELLTSVLMGRTESETMKIFLNKFAVGANTARRLVRTESAYIYNQMDTEAYKESGIEYYRFVATLDLKTSEVCKELDGKVFKTTDAQVGVNFPPMHPWCRSVTIANIDDDTLKTLDRRAGKEKVPADMTYKEWEDKFVVDVDNDIDYMSNSFRPRYGKAKEVYIDKIKMIVRPVKNSSFEMLTDTSNPRNKAVRLAEKIFREIQKELPETFEMPKIAVVDFKKQGLNKNAIGGYHQNSGTLFINSKYDTKQNILEFVNKNQGYFANTTEYAPYLHELGHKYYYDSIVKLATGKNICYSEAKRMIDYSIGRYIDDSCRYDELENKISGYADFGYKSSQYTEIVAECFSVKGNNIVARGIIQILEEV